MKHTIKLLGFIFIIIFLSCSEERQVDSEYGNISGQLRTVLTEIGSEKQLFSILTSQPSTIVGKEGTIILIPKESIVDQNNNLFTDSVIIELKEHFKLNDYLLSNLQTKHNDSLLVTDGMIFIRATDLKGNELKIAKGKKIRLEIPNSDYKNRPLIFVGHRDVYGLINWDLPKEQTKTLIPYPIRFISKKRFPTECSDFYGITKDTINNQHYNYYGDIDKFENTLLATKEFQERFSWYCWREILQTYIHNLNKNLWEIDEMVVRNLKKDSTERVEWYKNNPPSKVDGNPITKAQWEAHNDLLKMEQESLMSVIKTFEYFASQRLTKIDTTQFLDTTKLKELNTSFISYSAMDFGWVNVDYFYNNPKSVPIKMITKTNVPVPLINLIIKGKNVILTGIDKGNNEYWFTKNEDGYNKLPKGDTAIILGLGLNENDIVFASTEIIIGQQEIINLNLRKIQAKDLKDRLEKLR